MPENIAIYNSTIEFLNVLMLILIVGFNCHIFSAVILFSLSATWFLVGYKTLTTNGELIGRHWWLFTTWTLSMAWYLIAHCFRLLRKPHTHRYNPQRADAYVLWILGWTIVEVVLHAAALHIHKITAQNPVPYTLGDTLLLTLPAVMTVVALRCSMPKSLFQNASPAVIVKL